jgi:hypothetical protein
VLLGLQLLEAAFETFVEAREEILQLCHSHLLGSRQESGLPFILLITQLAGSYPRVLLDDHLARLEVGHVSCCV